VPLRLLVWPGDSRVVRAVSRAAQRDEERHARDPDPLYDLVGQQAVRVPERTSGLYRPRLRDAADESGDGVGEAIG